MFGDMKIQHKNFRTRTIAAAVTGVAMLALVGCGSDDDSAAASTTSASAAAATSTSAKSSATTSSGTSSNASAPAEGASAQSPAAAPSLAPGWNAKVFEHAGRTAIAAVPGSSLLSIEENSDGSWVVQLINTDGVAIEVGVSPDGDRIIAGPSATGGQTPATGEAKLDYTAATGIILTEVPGGRITDLNLAVEKGGTYVWEADVVDASGTRRAVDVDAVTGSILQNTPR